MYKPRTELLDRLDSDRLDGDRLERTTRVDGEDGRDVDRDDALRLMESRLVRPVFGLTLRVDLLILGRELILGLETLRLERTLDLELILGLDTLRLERTLERKLKLRLDPMLRELTLRLGLELRNDIEREPELRDETERDPELREETDREPPPPLDTRPRASKRVVGIAISTAATMANKYFFFIAHLPDLTKNLFNIIS